MDDTFLITQNYDYFLSIRNDMLNAAETEEEKEEALTKYQFMLPFLKQNIPLGELKIMMEGDIIEREVKEYDPVKEKFVTQMHLYEDLLNRYIDELDGKVLQEGYSFFFYGNNESGKTFCALHLLCSAIERGLSGYFIPLKEMVNLYNHSEFQNEYEDKAVFNYLLNCDFLVIDEVGKESSVTDNLLGVFEYLIKYRTTRNKPTVMTSNIDFTDGVNGFMGFYGNSLSSALMQHYKIIYFNPKGNFRKKMRKKWDL